MTPPTTTSEGVVSTAEYTGEPYHYNPQIFQDTTDTAVEGDSSAIVAAREEANLRFHQQVDTPDPVGIGEIVTYTIVLENMGPQDATNVVVHGFVSPYLVTNATESCFVPATMIEDHRNYLKSLDPEAVKGRKILREMPASMAVVEVVRFHSNQIQGMHRYMNLQGPGAGSPWVE